MSDKKIILDLLERSQQRLNGVVAIFAKAGFDLKGKVPSIQQFTALNQYHPAEFEEVIYFLYPEKKDENHASAAPWTTIVGAVLSGAGSAFSQIGNSDSEVQYQQLQMEKEMAEQQAAQQKKTLMIVLGLVAAVVVIGIALFVFVRKTK